MATVPAMTRRTVAALLVTTTLAIAAAAPPTAHAHPDVVDAARTAIGKPYTWAATGPNAFDCSGLVVWAYQQVGVSLPHSSQALAAGGQSVPRDQLEPGDVVVYYPAASHVGLYTGDDMVIHASRAGRPVAEVPIDAAGPYNRARRY